MTTPRRRRGVPSISAEPPYDDSQDRIRHRRHRRRKIAVGMWLLAVGSMSVTGFYLDRYRKLHPFDRIVVSLTTTPERLAFLHPTLESLIEKQTIKPHIVYLTLPDKTLDGRQLHYAIPDFVQTYLDHHQLYLIEPEFQVGPMMIVYAIEMESYDTRVIHVSDDRVYDENLIYTLYHGSVRHADAVVALQGANLVHGHEWNLETSGVLQVQPSFHQDRNVDITGSTAICVQRRFFQVESLKQLLLNKTTPAAVRSVEHILVSAYLEHEKVDRIQLLDESQNTQAIPDLPPTPDHTLLTLMQALRFAQKHFGIWNNANLPNVDELERNHWRCDQQRLDCNETLSKLYRQLEMTTVPNGWGQGELHKLT